MDMILLSKNNIQIDGDKFIMDLLIRIMLLNEEYIK